MLVLEVERFGKLPAGDKLAVWEMMIRFSHRDEALLYAKQYLIFYEKLTLKAIRIIWLCYQKAGNAIVKFAL